MAVIVTRAGKGSPLTHVEADANFNNLNAEAATNTAKVTNATHTGDVTGDTALTIAAGSVTLAKQANVATSTLLGRVTAATGVVEALTPAQGRTVLGLAAVATSGSAADLSAGLLPAARFDDTAHGARAGGTTHANAVAAGAAGFMTGADKTKLDGIATGAQVNVATNLSYVASTRALSSSSGTGATLPLATGTDAGLMASADFTKLAGIATGATAYVHPNHSGDVTSVADGAQTIAAGVVTNAKLANVGTATFKGRITAATGLPEDLTVAQAKTVLAYTPADIGAATAAQANATHTGDATGATALTIAAGVVTNAKLAPVATATFKGRVTAATGDPEDLTGTQATTLLNTFTSLLKGLVPASGGGTANFLRADGTFAAPAGGGDMVLASAQTNSALKTFLSGTFGLRNVANTFTALFTNAITAARTYTLKDADGTLAFTSDITGVNSGTNTGDQTITLTGQVTGTGTGSFATTIAANTVTLANQAALAANSVIGNATGTAATPAAVPMTSAATASTVAIRDANANMQNNNARQGYATIATAAGSTALAVGSAYLQFFTGTSTQTVVLPDVTTLVLGHQFYIRNLSTGLVTINSSGGSLIRILGPNTRCMVTCILLTGITAASWSAMYLGTTIADGKVLTANNSLTLSGTDGNALAINSATASVSNANTGDQTITLTGDVAGTGTGSFATTLATVNANVGAFGSATQVMTQTVNAKGLTTAAANVAISVPATAISDSTVAGRAMVTAASATAQTALLDLATTTAKGLAPVLSNVATQFLNGTGVYSTPAGGGSPGGTTGQIQFNNAGAFGGAANVEIASGNLRLVSAADPTAPTGGLLLYAKLVAGKVIPKTIGPSGIDTVLQNAIHGNSVFMASPANGTTSPVTIGGVLSTSTTISHVQTVASANPFQATRRTRFTSATTAAAATGARTNYTQWSLGNAAGFGGFFMRAQFGQSINLNGGQSFAGMCVQATILAGEPSAMLNMIGMGYDAADVSTGNWFLMRNDGVGVATKVDLGTGAARNVNDGYDLIIHAKPNTAEIFVRVTNLQTNTVVLDTSYTTDIIAANTAMAFKCECRNGAVAAAHSIDLAKAYIETDY